MDTLNNDDIIEQDELDAPVKDYPVSDHSVYIGPTIPGLARFTVFRGSKPPHVMTMENELPELSELIVPVDMLHEADSKVSTSGTMMHIIAETVRKHYSNRR